MRIPIVPSSGLAQKVKYLFCDDAAHFTDSGSPKKDNDAVSESVSCIYARKVLIVDLISERFCIVHDTGIGKDVAVSQQWWDMDEAAFDDVRSAIAEYKSLMAGTDYSLNWWQTIDRVDVERAIQSEPTLESRLRNGTLSKEDTTARDSTVPTPPPEGADWEFLEAGKFEDDYVEVPMLPGQESAFSCSNIPSAPNGKPRGFKWLHSCLGKD